MFLFFLILVEVMDVRDLKYKDNFFDLIIDKSTIDALLCGESSYLNVAIMLKEVQRTLKDEGYYVIISYGKPENRIIHLERPHLDFEIQVYTIKKDIEENPDLNKTHYVYICQKKKDANKVAEQNYDFVVYDLEQQELMDKELYEDEEDEENDDLKYGEIEDDYSLEDEYNINENEKDYEEDKETEKGKFSMTDYNKINSKLDPLEKKDNFNSYEFMESLSKTSDYNKINELLNIPITKDLSKKMGKLPSLSSIKK